MTDHQSILSRVTEPKWTPGPWHVNGMQSIRGPCGEFIAKANWQNGQPNARLIAAAPEMAALLEMWCGLYTRIDGDGDRPAHVATLALLAKTKGDAT